MEDLLVGADPELFLQHKGSFVSAFSKIPGTKEHPHQVTDGMVSVDGMALEIGIKPAASSGQFIRRITAVLKQLDKMIPRGMTTKISPYAFFTDEVMAETPKQAKELGCNPDFNAWTAEINPPPEAHPNIRVAGGHVHLGWTERKEPFDKDHFYSCCTLVRNLDFMLGVPSILIDKDTVRRQMYGKAGSFRPKPYGLEYRTLSNFWISDPKYMRWVFNQTNTAFKMLAKKGIALEKEHGDKAQRIIDTNDVNSAKQLCKELKIVLP